MMKTPAFEMVRDKRVFLPDPTTHYSEVQERTLDAVVGYFKYRIEQWYVQPAQQLATTHNFGFAVLAIDCLLVDTLSQFHEGIEASDEAAFKRLARQIPGFKKMIAPPISADVRDVGDAFWTGFRCPVLHEARLAPYCRIDPGNKQIVDIEDELTTHGDGSPCKTVMINPMKLLLEVENLFQQYIRELLKPKQEALRQRFKTKAENAFGITIIG